MSDASSLWRQPTLTQYQPPGLSPQALVTMTMSGLSPGTSYQCHVAANNSVGGFETDVFNAPFPNVVATFAEAPDSVSAATAGCQYEYDALLASGGAPGTARPSLVTTVFWDAPRPNDAQQMGLFDARDDRLQNAVRALDPDALSPREALEALYELRRLAEDS